MPMPSQKVDMAESQMCVCVPETHELDWIPATPQKNQVKSIAFDWESKCGI